jgi:enoyl-CoA hydratase
MEALDAVKRCAAPIVAAVNGPAIGGGFILLGHCDVIFAARSAWFSLPEIRLGLSGEPTTALRLLGPRKARSMLLSGERITAHELFRLGVIEALVEDSSVDERALAYAEKLAEHDPQALRLVKASIIRVEESGEK